MQLYEDSTTGSSDTATSHSQMSVIAADSKHPQRDSMLPPPNTAALSNNRYASIGRYFDINNATLSGWPSPSSLDEHGRTLTRGSDRRPSVNSQQTLADPPNVLDLEQQHNDLYRTFRMASNANFTSAGNLERTGIDGGAIRWEVIRSYTTDRAISRTCGCSFGRVWRLVSSFVLCTWALLVNHFLLAYLKQQNLIHVKSAEVGNTLAFLRLPEVTFIPYVLNIWLGCTIVSWFLSSMFQKDRWIILTRFLWAFAMFLEVRAMYISFSYQPVLYCPRLAVVSPNLFVATFQQLFDTFYNLCSLGLPSISTGLTTLCAAYFFLYTKSHFAFRLLFAAFALGGNLMLVLFRKSFAWDVFSSVFLSFGIACMQATCVWSYHAAGKVGWQGYNWDHPFSIVLRVFWFMDGLDASLLRRRKS